MTLSTPIESSLATMGALLAAMAVLAVIETPDSEKGVRS